MKKRVRRGLFGVLLCFGLSTMTVQADEPVDYGVTINETAVTAANAADVLADEQNTGKVSYNAETNTLTISGSIQSAAGELEALTIDGNNGTNVEIDGGENVISSGLTITNGGNVTVSSSHGIYGIDGAVNIDCVGDVLLKNTGTGSVTNNALNVTNAKNVTVTVATTGASAITGITTINCDGAVLLENTGNGCVTGNNLNITKAGNVTVTTATIGAPVLTGQANISCSGDVQLTNTGTGHVSNSNLTITGAKNVTVTGKTSGSPVISGTVEIDCTGDVLIENKGTGIAVNGSALVITNAGNVTVTANKSYPTISTSYAGDGVKINCSGDILIENTGTGMTVSGPFVVTNANDVTVKSSSTSPTIGGTVEISCTGDVMIENAGDSPAVSSNMKITKAANVIVKSKSVSSSTISGIVEIDCTGDVLIENKGTGLAVSGSALVVTNAENVTVTATSSSPTIWAFYSGDGVTINCSGDVLIENKGTGLALNGPKFVVSNAKAVTVKASSESPTISVNVTVEIDCTGDVMIENAGDGMAVTSGMKITKAENVTVKSKSVSSPTIGGTVEIDCTGNVLIENLGNYLTIASGMKITKAENVTVKSTSDAPTITGIVEINCTGNVLLENKGTGQAVYGSVTLHQKSGGTGYAVWTGEERAQLQLISEKENTESYTAERVSDSVIYVGSNDHKVTKIEAKDATCTKEGNQEHYLCSCGKIYQDALGLEEIKDPQSVKISATGHTDGSEWKKDDTAHWHECTVNGCGAVIESSKSGHTYTDDADTTCDVCGYVRTIIKTPASDKNDNSEKSDSATGGVLYPCKTPTGTVSPKTGDSNQVFLWSLLLGVSVVGMYANRKKNCGMK